jgi:NAD(P)-dependent dehydrogenase (short-subunit alcohol dehydrogenase family)
MAMGGTRNFLITGAGSGFGRALATEALSSEAAAVLSGPMAAFIFTCPATSMKVQHLLDDDEDVPENQYEPITCPACTRLHFLNRKTGKLLGQDDE